MRGAWSFTITKFSAVLYDEINAYHLEKNLVMNVSHIKKLLVKLTNT